MSKKYIYLMHLLTSTALVGSGSVAWAGGIQLDQNVTNLGTAYAGTASLAEDASTGFYNPAGLTRLGEEQISVSGIYIDVNAKPKGELVTSTSGVPLGAGKGKVNGNGLVSGVHYAKRISDCWVLGFNLTSPFGLKSNYKRDSIVRYMVVRSEVRMLDISPSIAYAFDYGFSLGVGIDGIYTATKLDAALDVGGRAIPSTDGYLENTTDAWSWGYHAGVLWEITDCTRIGFNYRSKFNAHTKGHSLLKFSNIDPLTRQQGVKVDVTFPEILTLSIHQGLGEQWAVMADVQWTKWSQFHNLVSKYDDGSQITSHDNLKNAVRIAAGATYQFNDAWMGRFGVAYDKTPTNDAGRSLRAPDNTRIWAALGAQYQFCEALTVDAGYAHLFFKKARLNEMAPTMLTSPQSLQGFRGEVKPGVNLFGLQLTWNFI